MGPEERSTLQRLLLNRRVASLGVLRDGAPYVAMMPFALERETGAVLIHASRLGLHSRGLQAGAPFSLLVHAGEDESDDPLQLPRVSIQGTVSVVAKDTEAFPDARAAYLRKYPAAAQTFALGDFELYRLTPTGARFVAGFGRIHSLRADDLVMALDASPPDPLS